MKNIILTVVITVNLSGCAAICSPVAQTSAMYSNNPKGTVVALAEFGACAAYDLAKIAVTKLLQPSREEKKTEPPAQVAPVATEANEPTYVPIQASGDADAM